mgnify:CR=1 FL=1
MRLHKPAADEPWRVAELLDHRHRGGGDLTIRLIVIRAIRRAPLTPFQRLTLGVITSEETIPSSLTLYGVIYF